MRSGMGKGSGRSIEGLSLVEALGRCERWLEKFGGHEMAAGLTMREENFAAVCRRHFAARRASFCLTKRCSRAFSSIMSWRFPQLNSELLALA